VTRAIDVRVVTGFRLVLDVRGVDGDATRLFFGRRVDLIVRLGFAAELLRQDRGDRRGQRGLAVVNVPMVPTLTWGLVRSNLPFAMFVSP